MCVLFLSSFCVVLSSLLFPLCVFVCYVSVSIGSVFCVCSVSWSVSVGCSVCVLCLFYCVSACYPFLSICSLYVCLLYVSYICVACICYWSVYLCVCVSYMYVCVIPACTVSCMCACVLLLLYALCLCVYCVRIPVYLVYCLCVFSLYVCICVYCVSVFFVCCVCVLCLLCMCLLCLCVSLLCCWLPCWCGVYHGGVMGACFLGLVVLVFWGVWRVWNFFIFLFTVSCGWSSFVRFLLSHIFCGFPWGLCHARNFFKDITHSYYGYVAPVMSLYMRLLAHLYHTRYCADTVPVLPFVLVPISYLLSLVLRLCFVLCCPGIVSALTPCLVSACACITCLSMLCITFRIGCRCLVLGWCAVWGVLLVVVCFTCWFYTLFFLCLFALFGRIVIADDYPPY